MNENLNINFLIRGNILDTPKAINHSIHIPSNNNTEIKPKSNYKENSNNFPIANPNKQPTPSKLELRETQNSKEEIDDILSLFSKTVNANEYMNDSDDSLSSKSTNSENSSTNCFNSENSKLKQKLKHSLLRRKREALLHNSHHNHKETRKEELEKFREIDISNMNLVNDLALKETISLKLKDNNKPKLRRRPFHLINNKSQEKEITSTGSKIHNVIMIISRKEAPA